jgi:uncharacterized protein YegJ (DUF2314 family)
MPAKMPERKSIPRRFQALRLVLALACVCAGAACHPPASAQSSQAPEAPIAYVDKQDAEVNASIAEARRNLPIFWRTFDRQPEGVDRYGLKIRFPTQSGGGEHIWIDVTSRNGDDIVGVIDNDPEYRPDLKLGMTVHVKAADITDWSYRRGGKMFGGFTTRVLLKHLDEADAAKTRTLLSPSPVEPGV